MPDGRSGRRTHEQPVCADQSGATPRQRAPDITELVSPLVLVAALMASAGAITALVTGGGLGIGAATVRRPVPDTVHIRSATASIRTPHHPARQDRL
jgi:hypothetical protein